MAITQVSSVAPQRQQTKVRKSPVAEGLGNVLGVAGGIAGGIAAAPGVATTGLGAISGTQAGKSLGQAIGEGVTPTRTEQIPVTAQIPPQLQGFKFSQNGMTVLDALASADRLGPEFAEHKEPLAIALMEDIAANNRGGQA